MKYGGEGNYLPKLAISQSCFKSNVDLTKGQ
jgi:hypothetical protein